MDLLDRVLPAGLDLLGRVGAVLAVAGAPADAPIWPPLRRLRLLPADAVDAIAGLDPAPIRAAATRLRGLREEYAERGDAVVALAGVPHWGGAGADSFGVSARAQGDHLADGLAGRVGETAAFFDEVADWAVEARNALAGALGQAIGSVEAVQLCAANQPVAGTVAVPEPDTVDAAVVIGARILATVSEAYERAEELHRHWAGRLDELPFQAPTLDRVSTDGVTWSQL